MRRIAFPAILFWLLVFAAPFVLDGWQNDLRDVHTYIWAGEVLRAGDAEALYTIPQGGQWDYVYPPAFASAWALFVAVFGPDGVYYFWLIVCLASVWVVGILARRESGVWVVAASSPFLLYLVAHGQVGAIMVTLVIGTLWAVREDRTWLAAVLVAGAVHLKLYPVVLILVLWLHGKPQTAKRALALSAAGCLIPTLWVGTDVGSLYLAYAHRLTNVAAKNLSLGSMLPDVVLPGLALAALFTALRAGSVERSARLAYTGVILSSPLVHLYTFTNLLVVYPLIEKKAVRVALSSAFFGASVFAIGTDIEYGWPGLTMIGWAIWLAAAVQVFAGDSRRAGVAAMALPGVLVLGAALHGVLGLPAPDAVPDASFRVACERSASEVVEGDSIVWEDPPRFEGGLPSGILLVMSGDSIVRSLTCQGTREGDVWRLDVRPVPFHR